MDTDPQFIPEEKQSATLDHRSSNKVIIIIIAAIIGLSSYIIYFEKTKPVTKPAASKQITATIRPSFIPTKVNDTDPEQNNASTQGGVGGSLLSYAELKKGCDGYSVSFQKYLCLGSIVTMEAGGYLPEPTMGCPQGYVSSAAVSSFRANYAKEAGGAFHKWCMPVSGVFMDPLNTMDFGVVVDTSAWTMYRNDKNKFSLLCPPQLQSENNDYSACSGDDFTIFAGSLGFDPAFSNSFEARNIQFENLEQDKLVELQLAIFGERMADEDQGHLLGRYKLGGAPAMLFSHNIKHRPGIWVIRLYLDRPIDLMIPSFSYEMSSTEPISHLEQIANDQKFQLFQRIMATFKSLP